MKPHWIAPFLLLAAAAALPGRAPAETVALLHARVVDGSGGAPIEDATVVVDGERIAAVGRAADVAVPAHAKTIDLAGRTILPGLISDHSHLGMVDGVASGHGHYTRENVVRQLRQYQRYGVTTVTSLGLNGALFETLRREAHAGTLPGADFFGADRGIGVPGGAPPLDVGADQIYRPAIPVEARADVDESAARHPDLIKLWVDDFHGSLPSKMSPDVYRAVIDEAHRKGLRVAAHVYYLDDAKRLVADGVDVLAHGVRDRAVDDELIAAMKARGTWYVPTLGLDESFYVYAERPAWMRSAFFRAAVQPALMAQFDDPEWRAKALAPKARATNQAALATNLANLKRLHDAGVNIGFGTDSGATPLRIPGFAEHRELALCVQAGLTPVEAIHLATAQAARLLALDDRGLIAPGKRADLLVVAGDPARRIEDVDRIEAVWQRGQRVAGAVASATPPRRSRSRR
ncbi:MAG TPA: amidohydrolase family protein [Dokdonella sp.]